MSALLIGLAPAFAEAARAGHGGGARSGGSHFSGGHSGGAHVYSGPRYSGARHYGGPRYYGGYHRSYGGYALGLGVLGAAIAAPYYYSAPYGYAYPPAAYDYGYAPSATGAYYCGSYNAYYPQVAACPEGWQQVVPPQPPY
jgi:hypothetical protein